MKVILKDKKTMISIPDSIFNYPFKETLIHQVIVSYLGKSRQGSRSQKTRSEVSGSGKKPWRQKGTGRARAGDVKSPIWRSGGVTFAAKPKKYLQKINKKMYCGAIKSIFSDLLRKDRLIFLEKIEISAPKTKLLLKKMKEFSLNNALIIYHKENKNLILAARNLYKISVNKVSNINPVSLISFDKVVIIINAIKNIEESFI